MNTEAIKSLLTPKVLGYAGSVIAAVVPAVYWFVSNVAWAEDVQRTTAQIAIDAQDSLVDFRLEQLRYRIQDIYRWRKIDPKMYQQEQMAESLNELREERKVLRVRKDRLKDEARQLMTK